MAVRPARQLLGPPDQQVIPFGHFPRGSVLLYFGKLGFWKLRTQEARPGVPSFFENACGLAAYERLGVRLKIGYQ